MAITCALLTACVGQAPERVGDPRLGEQGLVRFVGGGCSGSTTMAVGSRVTLELVPATEQALPDELKVKSSAPDVIGAIDAEPHHIELSAKKQGSSHIELLHGGALYDALTFSAERAVKVVFVTPQRVFVDGSYDAVVTEVYGSCGTEDCPLIGHSFLKWSIEPAESLLLLGDDGGTASFRAGPAGSAVVVGREPVSGKALVQAPVELVPTSGVTGIEAIAMTVPVEEGQQEVTVQLPGALPANHVFCIRLNALRGGEAKVAISRRDVKWSISGGEVEAVKMEHASEPTGTLFLSGSALAEVQLTVEIPLLDRTESYVLTVQ